MLAANYTTVRNNLKDYCDAVYDNDETLVITRKGEKNIVMISIGKYTMFEKMINNNQYMMVLEKSNKQIREGNVVVKTMEELEDMAE